MRFIKLWHFTILAIGFSLSFGGDYDFQRYYSKKWRISPNEIVVLENPIGEIHITNTAPEVGPFVVVKQKIFASMDELAKSRQFVMMVRLADTRRPDSLILETIMPTHMFTEYCYPDMGGFFSPKIEYVCKGTPITVSARSGVKLWSDIFVEVPKGQKIKIKSIVSGFVVEDFEGDIDLETNYASVMTAGDIVGNLFLTACHGALSVSKFSGELFYDGEDSDITFCDVIKGKVYAKSVTGDIMWTAKCDSVELVELESVSGKIIFNGGLSNYACLRNDLGKIEIEPTSRLIDSLSATTNDGDIGLKIRENFAAKLLARTPNGKIKHKLPIKNDKEIETQLKGQSGKIFLYSTNGVINIRIDGAK